MNFTLNRLSTTSFYPSTEQLLSKHESPRIRGVVFRTSVRNSPGGTFTPRSKTLKPWQCASTLNILNSSPAQAHVPFPRQFDLSLAEFQEDHGAAHRLSSSGVFCTSSRRLLSGCRHCSPSICECIAIWIKKTYRGSERAVLFQAERARLIHRKTGIALLACLLDLGGRWG